MVRGDLPSVGTGDSQVLSLDGVACERSLGGDGGVGTDHLECLLAEWRCVWHFSQAVKQLGVEVGASDGHGSSFV